MRPDPDTQIGEHETKFVFANRFATKARSWLQSTCIPDPNYGEGIVSSIYYDTPDLRYLGEKLASDYLKTKFRVRWYSSQKTGTAYPGIFMEAKYKIGSARKKLRKRIDNRFDWVLEKPLDHSDYIHLSREYREFALAMESTIVPVFEISYTRSRYIEPFTGARLSVDSDIHVPRTNKSLVAGNTSSTLAKAVFELKEISGALPDRLSPLLALTDAKRSSFSKYSECYAHVQNIIY